MSETYRIITEAQDTEKVSHARSKIHAAWPEFMLHDPVSDLFTELYELLPEYQSILVDKETEEPVALGNSAPLAWDSDSAMLPDRGWDWALEKAIDGVSVGEQPTILCALQVVAFGENKGRGISSLAVAAMKENGRKHGLTEMIAPVRPSLKSSYPLASIDNYIKWQNDEGYPFDPWLRVHVKQGATIIKPCHESMRITGTIAEWQAWTGMRFPEGGDYIIPGATMPISIDVDRDEGVYIEPNVWVHHPAKS